MDGKQGKLLIVIMGPRPMGIRKFEPMTNNKHDKIMSSSRPSELTLKTII